MARGGWGIVGQARKYVRGHLYWEGYIVSPLSASTSSLSVYLRLSGDPIPPETMWRFGLAMAASLSGALLAVLQVAAFASWSVPLRLAQAMGG